MQKEGERGRRKSYGAGNGPRSHVLGAHWTDGEGATEKIWSEGRLLISQVRGLRSGGRSFRRIQKQLRG